MLVSWYERDRGWRWPYRGMYCSLVFSLWGMCQICKKTWNVDKNNYFWAWRHGIEILSWYIFKINWLFLIVQFVSHAQINSGLSGKVFFSRLYSSCFYNDINWQNESQTNCSTRWSLGSYWWKDNSMKMETSKYIEIKYKNKRLTWKHR